MEELAWRAEAVALLSLRIAPTLAFTPPFTLMQIPASVRVLLAIALAGWLAAGQPEAVWGAPIPAGGLPAIAVSELVLGIGLALALQLAFAALLFAGRMLDVQAGFGLAMIADPTTKAQLPLAGTVLAYAAAITFFAIDGPAELLAIWSASLAAVPLGAGAIGADAITALGSYMSAVFLLAMGAAALVLLVLFLLDLAIAFMSRTLPQMNVLLLGFQVKALAMLVTLPIALALGAGLFLRLVRLALERTPGFVG